MFTTAGKWCCSDGCLCNGGRIATAWCEDGRLLHSAPRLPLLAIRPLLLHLKSWCSLTPTAWTQKWTHFRQTASRMAEFQLNFIQHQRCSWKYKIATAHCTSIYNDHWINVLIFYIHVLFLSCKMLQIKKIGNEHHWINLPSSNLNHLFTVIEVHTLISHNLHVEYVSHTQIQLAEELTHWITPLG